MRGIDERRVGKGKRAGIECSLAPSIAQSPYFCIKDRILKQNLFITATSILLLMGCSPNNGLFEKNVAIPQHAWSSSFKPEISFEIKDDTTSYYRIFLVLRHTDAYRYKNIWLNVGVQSPGDSMRINRVNLTLAQDDRGWLGKGMDDIFEHRVLLEAIPRRFSRTGTYKFTIQQIMREDPLEHVMNAGIRLEKVPG
jgi:gliding motility-associated lipoprotein GldH